MDILREESITTVFIAIILAQGVNDFISAFGKYIIYPFIRENLNLNSYSKLDKLLSILFQLIILGVISVFIYRKFILKKNIINIDKNKKKSNKG